MGEKRRYIRFNVLMSAICRAGNALRELKVSNFSKEGIGILSQEPFALGDDMEIELSIPGDNVPVLLQGTVAWTQGPSPEEFQHKSGLQFSKVSNDDRSRLLEYIYHKWITPANAELK